MWGDPSYSQPRASSPFIQSHPGSSEAEQKAAKKAKGSLISCSCSSPGFHLHPLSPLSQPRIAANKRSSSTRAHLAGTAGTPQVVYLFLFIYLCLFVYRMEHGQPAAVRDARSQAGLGALLPLPGMLPLLSIPSSLLEPRHSAQKCRKCRKNAVPEAWNTLSWKEPTEIKSAAPAIPPWASLELGRRCGWRGAG